MRKILIINKSFDVGGIQSSMVNMANELCKDYEVDLFLYNPAGKMQSRLSKDVHVLPSSWRFRCLGMSLAEVLKTKNIKMIAFRLFAMAWSKLFDNGLPVAMAIKHQPRLTGYDLAIAYHQEQRKKAVTSGFVRVADQCVDAKRKVAWLHFDSDTIDLDSAFNNPFYEKMDKVVCVSKALMEGFARNNPTLSEKMDYCHNFLLYDAINQKSLEQQQIDYPAGRFVCFSACRISEEKALDRCIRAIADTLKQLGDVVWYIAGDGPERKNVENAICENGVEEFVRLIGSQSNPYPYMKNADLVMNVSYHEAAPMVFFESKALGVPVFATQTASVAELLNDGVSAFVCENSEEGIREKFAYIMTHRELVSAAKCALAESAVSNDDSLDKIKSLFV